MLIAKKCFLHHAIFFPCILGGPAPTIKVSTNNELAEFKKNWIDFNAGTLLTGETMPEATQRLMKRVIATANGEATCSEKNGYREIAIFKDGVTL
ncbi:MAG: UxaA family hydrolase [Victivallaceae bacterium]|nr:UxaA family hydrolase [Victivallaceae bacterium]